VPRSEPAKSDPEAATKIVGRPGGAAAAKAQGEILREVAEVGFHEGRSGVAYGRLEGEPQAGAVNLLNRVSEDRVRPGAPLSSAHAAASRCDSARLQHQPNRLLRSPLAECAAAPSSGSA